MDVTDAPSLRDSIADSFDIVEQGGDLNAPKPVIAAEAPPENTPGVEPAPSESAEQKADRLANRVRGADGRLLPGTKEPEPVVQQPAPASVVPPVARPSSWKKDHHADFDKIAAENPKLAQYLNQREQEFASGVSQYKQQADQARPLVDVVAQFMPVLQRFNLDPPQTVRNLLAAHERLSLGSPQEKIAYGAQIIRDYGIDAQALFQVLSGQAPMPQVQQRAAPQVDVRAEINNALAEREIETTYQQFLADVRAEKYPHYEAVKDTMAGLLQIGKAQDYASAYDKAIRLHDDIWSTEQLRLSQQSTQQQVAAKQATVARARANAVSVKSATPSGASATPKANSLRGTISDAFDEVVS